MNNKWLQIFFPLRKIAEFTEVDGTVAFYNVIASRLSNASVILDFGAGRGGAIEDSCSWRRSLVGTQLWPGAKRIAVDVDDIVLLNPFAQEKYVININSPLRIPVGDSKIDVIICDWVVEHLADPLAVFMEFQRVLKPGGLVAIRTSNKWHYAYLAAMLLSNGKVARWAMERVQPMRSEKDVFPKYYRCNTRGSLRRALIISNFYSSCTLTVDPEPAYVGDGFWGNLLGFIYHRCALLGLLPRGTLWGFACKNERSCLPDRG